VDDRRWEAFCIKREAIEREMRRLEAKHVDPEKIFADDSERVFGQTLAREASLLALLRRPEVSYAGLMTLTEAGEPVSDPFVAEQVEIQAKYAGYIERQQLEITRQRRNEELSLPEALDYQQVRGLSNEVMQKLSLSRPSTLGQAGRIPGVTPAAISLLLVYMKKHYGRELGGNPALTPKQPGALSR
jgi:tRNA uridine 5-carboxymethylaminomethyl modification enzyme